MPKPLSPTGQLLMIGIPGKEMDSATAALIQKVQPGAFILFGRNIESPGQLRKLTDDLRHLSKSEPIITIDQEGGRVSRLKLIGNEPPNAQQLRTCGDETLIRTHGEITGRLLRLFGFNLDLCPVLDISFDDEADNSLRGRCYGTTASEVIARAGLFNDALRSTGILSCGKHFPGYSCVPFDPHHELPVMTRSRVEMEQHELAVFSAFSDRVDSMMIGHAVYKDLDDSGLPASLAPGIIDGLLRKELGFRGLVMTDDLDMGAILNHYPLPETLRLGVEAGNDLLMICHRTELAEEALHILDRIPSGKLDRALEFVQNWKTRLAPPDVFNEAAFQALDGQVWDLRVAVLGEEKARELSPEDGKRSPVEVY